MRDVAAVADQLRRVRGAYERFLAMAAIDYILDRATTGTEDDARSRAIADYHNHDWTTLYRGSVLDD